MESWMKPMLCDKAPSLDGFDPATWAAEAKMDGWRAICHVGVPINGDVTNGLTVKLYGGRNGSDYSGQVGYLEAALALALPPDTCVDGELLASGGWGGVQGAMTRAGCGDDSLSIVIFDVLRVSGHDVRAMPWTERRKLVEAIQVSEKVRVSPVFKPAQDLLDTVLETGFEGLVLKRKSSRYVNGRSPAWVKIKPAKSDSCEAKVIGFKPGKGSLAGKVGAFEIELLDNGARTTIKCGTDERHDDATAHPERWLHQIIEIRHHGIFPSGKPRHPQFFRRRDDRNPVSAQQSEIAPPIKSPNRRADVPRARMRNYGAMGDAKLLRCVDELMNRSGDAFDSCVEKGGDPSADLAEARRVAGERGL